jgi:hypothetical protein
MKKVESLEPVVNNGDDDGPDEPEEQFAGPRLYVCDEDVRKFIVNGQGGVIIDRSFSRCDNLIINQEDDTHFSGQLTVFNRGNSLASLCTVKLVLWGRKTLGSEIAKPVRILGYQTIERLSFKDVIIPRINVLDHGFTDFAQISHIYAVVSEQMFDPLEPAGINLIMEANSNRRNFEVNPCRRSRQICCWTPLNANVFEIRGNEIIQNSDGGLEVVCRSAGIAPSVIGTFALNSPSTGAFSISIQTTFDFNVISRCDYVPLQDIPGKLRFRLDSTWRGNIVYSDSGKKVDQTGNVLNEPGCEVISHGEYVELFWNESNDDNDYDDYIIRVIYR